MPSALHQVVTQHTAHAFVCVIIFVCVQAFSCVFRADGRPAPELCFKEVNAAGNMYGNCGKDLLGKYRSCKER